MKKLCWIMIFCLLFSTTAIAEVLPNVDAKAGIIMEYDTGRVLWEKNADTPLANASTTKIMTAILAIEKCGLQDVVTASKKAAATPPVKMYLEEGEQQRLEDLLYALMLESSNDAAVAIAEHVGGTVENFCQMMTIRAAELGATNTVFRTPNGLDLGDHHSTARDLAIIARYALSNKDFLKIIATKSITTPVNGGNFKPHSVVNKDRLLHEFAGALGIKTGYTGKAGHCFVGAAKQDGMLIISVVLASGWGDKGREQKWVDTKALLNYAFDNFEYTTLAKKDTVAAEALVLFAKEKSVGLVIKEGLSIPVTKAEKESITYKINAPETIEAPLSYGDKLGDISFYAGDKLISQIDLIADRSLDRHDFKTSMGKIIKSWLETDLEDIWS